MMKQTTSSPPFASGTRPIKLSLEYLQKLSPEARPQVGAQALLCANHAALGIVRPLNRLPTRLLLILT